MARSGFRLRLRTLLISLVVGGAVAGLGGRLLLEEPNLFIGILAAVTLLGPALLGVATLIWLGARERRRPLLLWGLALAVTPLLGGAAILALETVARGPGGLGMLATNRLIQTELVAQVDEPWVWDELQRRLADGHLAAEQVNDATQVLTDHMRFTRPNGWGQPLSWQDRFLAPAIGSGMVTNETLVDLCDAYYGTRPRLEPLKRLRERDTGFGIEVHYGNIWAGNSAALPQLVWTVKQVRLDGEPLKVRQTSAGRDDWSGYCDQRVPVGEHQLQVVIEAAYVPASKMVGLNPRDVAPGGLPAGLKQWESTLTQPLTIHSNDETLVKLLTSPADLQGGHGVSAKRLVVQKLREGRKKIVLVVDSQPTTGPTVSFHVAVRLDDQLIPLDGALYRVVTDGSVTTGGSQFEATVPSLVTDAKQAEVVLTPDPSGVERFPEVDATWGAPVTIRGVPVERLDLKSDGVPHSTSPSNDPSDP